MADIEEEMGISPHSALHKIWARTRIRSYAHHFAAERIRRQARRVFRREFCATVLSLALLIAGLSISEPRLVDLLTVLSGYESAPHILHLTSHLLILASVFVSVWALFLAVMSLGHEKVALQGRHKLMSRLYMSMSQKTRRIEADVYSEPYYEFLTCFLNDQLESLLTAGENPEDGDYKLAHERMDQVMASSTPGVRSSFVPGAEPDELEALVDRISGDERRGAAERSGN